MSTSSVSSCREGGRTVPAPPPAMTTLVAPAARDWAALPSDIVLDVFLRLGPLDVLLDAELACKPWRRVALEEPTLWRRVGFDKRDYSDERWRRSCHDFKENMWQVALDRAKGQCEAFKGSCHDDDLLHLVGRCSPSSRSLRLISDISLIGMRTCSNLSAKLVLT
ncbi:hypothetical protein HU200_056121 [Digitaria exilis]|uniref:F-box domain-containing protein n=1 Tax=Digitaria exilis TaxID=1010633 RepID=A0A835ARY8_9POAL|nr:hypothetical protein HU200_056121 [Digitaria exilis]